MRTKFCQKVIMNNEIEFGIGNKCKTLNEIATFLDETVSKVALSFMLL